MLIMAILRIVVRGPGTGIEDQGRGAEENQPDEPPQGITITIISSQEAFFCASCCCIFFSFRFVAVA